MTTVITPTVTSIPVTQNYTENYNDSCIPYHIKYKDPSSHYLIVFIFAVLYTSIFLFGILGNFAVLIITYRHKSLQTVQNIFILNLVIADILSILISVPLTPPTHIYKQWFFGSIMCKIVTGIQALGSFIASFSLCAIAVDRYFSLVISPGNNSF